MFSNPPTKYSFLNLIQENSIVIPHLQRDYAQGRKTENKKLKNFLEFLKNALEREEAVNLDFVFGYFEEQNNGKSFIPIDGQQRLTTVFLLHWYLAVQSDDYSVFKDLMFQQREIKFTYQTRISSQEFITSIVSEGLDRELLLTSDNEISTLVENCGWFYFPWKEDSTVEAMLNALDTIHAVFNNASNLKLYYSKLEKGLISFEFLNPDEIELSDEFYIKMNARGLPLTPFENFKADLLNTLSIRLPEEKEIFAQRLDGTWSDAIWNWSIRSKIGKTENAYDNSFKNVFNFLFQMCYSKVEQPENTSSYNLTEHYKDLLNQENYNYINDTFNFIVDIDKYCVENEEFELIPLYNKLFNTSNPSHSDKMKLYGILQYQRLYGIELQNNDFLNDFIRIIDNVLVNTNQSKKRMFVTDLRTSRYKELLNFIDELLSNQNPYEALANMSGKNEVINHEIEKARIILDHPMVKKDLQRLENHTDLKGCLLNFMFVFDDPSTSKDKVDLFYELWSPQKNTDLSLYRSLFSLGDYVVDVAGSGLGRVFYAGKSGQWHRVLANTNRESKEQIKIFKTLFDYLEGTKLEKVFSKLESIPLPPQDNWRYYLANYPEILQGHNLFVYKENQGTVPRLELMKGEILSTSHTGYLNHAVIKELEKQDIKLSSDLHYYFSSVSWSSLRIDKTEMIFNGEGWKVITDLKLVEDIDLNITPKTDNNNEYIISSSTLNLVEQIVLFIKSHFSIEK